MICSATKSLQRKTRKTDFATLQCSTACYEIGQAITENVEIRTPVCIVFSRSCLSDYQLFLSMTFEFKLSARDAYAECPRGSKGENSDQR